jgi:hypothetical protein
LRIIEQFLVKSLITTCNDNFLKLVWLFSWLISKVKGKVKWNLVQTLRLCTGRTAYRGVEV